MLSAFFCCFSDSDASHAESASSRQRLSPAQTNLQKALSNKSAAAAGMAASSVPVKGPASQKKTAKKADAAVQAHAHAQQQPSNHSEPSDRTEQDTDVKQDLVDHVSLQTDTTDTLDLAQILPEQAVAESGWLLNPIAPELRGKKCLVLDLDETLVHSSFKYVRHSDFVIPVEIENQIHNVYVIKRPGVDEFLRRCGELFEIVIFTASVSRYGDPLLDILDVHKVIHHRLFRESCYNYDGNYIKNLSQMGRPLEDLIIIDNSPASYVFHPQHAVPVSSWFSDSHDCELLDLMPFLEDLADSKVDDVSLVLDVNI